MDVISLKGDEQRERQFLFFWGGRKEGGQSVQLNSECLNISCVFSNSINIVISKRMIINLHNHKAIGKQTLVFYITFNV